MRLTREQRRLFFDGEFPKIEYPGAEPCPVQVGEQYRLTKLSHLEVTKIRRSRKGDWVVVYEMYRIESPLFLATRSPRAGTQKERDEFTEEQARGYTRSRSEGLDKQADAVYFASDNDPILVDARKRFAEHRKLEAKDEQVDEDARQLARQIRDVAVAINRSGANPLEFLADLQRQVSAKRDEIRDAA